MTDLIERVDAAFSEGAGDTPADAAPESNRRDVAVGTTRPLHILLAVSLGGSAVLLFAMSSGHLHGARATVGIVAALAQVALAVGALTRPSRALFGVAVAVNVAIAGFWLAVEGPQAVSAATAGIGVALSSVVLLVAAALCLQPALGRTWSSATSVIGSVVPVAVAALSIAGLFLTTTAVATPTSSSASATPGGSAAALALSTTVKVPGENSKTFQSIVAGNDTEQSELKKWVPLNAHDQALLTNQLYGALLAAERYPTVASAKAAGMILAGGMAPGVGAHYQMISADTFKGINSDGSVNPAYPASWIYASTADNAPVVGVMYISMTAKAPSGFIGPNDHWHQHSNVCIQYANGKIGVPFAADQSVTPQECADVHGIFMKKTVWMVHAWVVPGWESPQGVFSHDNLHVYCPGNTDLTDAVGFCVRQS
jgi:hypothetical protein